MAEQPLPVARRPPDRRVRFRRALCGDQARRGRRDRLPGDREGRRRRRHLARQHLPRCLLRHPEPALLVLLRAQPRLVVVVLPAARDPGLPPPRRPASTASPRAPSSAPSSSTPRGTTRRSAGTSVRRPARSPHGPSSPRAGSLSEPRLPEIEGIESFGGAALPLRPLGPLGRPRRQARRGDRHRCLGDPDRPRGAAGGRPSRRLPAHRPVGDPPQRPHLPEGRAGRPAPAPGPRPALPDRHLLGARGLRAGVHLAAAAGGARAEGRAGQHPPGASRTPRCARR